MNKTKITGVYYRELKTNDKDDKTFYIVRIETEKNHIAYKNKQMKKIFTIVLFSAF